MTRPRPAGITLLAPAAGSGKTGIAMGVARALADEGVHVEPFKAVSVVAPDDLAYGTVPPWRRGVLHNCAAARRSALPWHNPVSVIRPSREARCGDLYVWGQLLGEVSVPGDDLLNLADIPAAWRHACRDAVTEACAMLRATGGFAVVEGGGAAGDIAPDDDLANHVVPALLECPVALVLNAARSGQVAALLGVPELLAPEIRALLVGYVANQVRDEEHHATMAARLAGSTALRRLAVIDEVQQPAEYDGSERERERVYARRAAQVADSGLLGVIRDLCGVGESLAEVEAAS